MKSTHMHSGENEILSKKTKIVFKLRNYIVLKTFVVKKKDLSEIFCNKILAKKKDF